MTQTQARTHSLTSLGRRSCRCSSNNAPPSQPPCHSGQGSKYAARCCCWQARRRAKYYEVREASSSLFIKRIGARAHNAIGRPIVSAKPLPSVVLLLSSMNARRHIPRQRQRQRQPRPLPPPPTNTRALSLASRRRRRRHHQRWRLVTFAQAGAGEKRSRCKRASLRKGACQQYK